MFSSTWIKEVRLGPCDVFYSPWRSADPNQGVATMPVWHLLRAPLASH